MKLLLPLLGAFLPITLLATLPTDVTITKPTSLEILRDGKVSGSIELPAGAKVDVVDLDEPYVIVRYRRTNGRVKIASTSLPPDAINEDNASLALPPRPEVAKAAPAHARAPSAMQRTFSGTLVHLEGSSLKRFDAARLGKVKFYAVYYSASWCPPCRAFTPSLVEAYGKIRSLYPEFELVFVSNDYSAEDMEAYMHNDRMQWPAVGYNLIHSSPKITSYAGPGIPCLVFMDESGKVLSDSYHGDHYVGPHAVLNDIWNTLRDYRAQNPN